MVRGDVNCRVEELDSISGTHRLALSHVDSLKEKLSVEVTDVNSVQVDHVQVCEAC